MTLQSNEDKSSTRLSSSTDGMLSGVPSLVIRQHLTPHSHQILQRSPSSTTPPVTRTSPAEAFRSQRGSLSFDTRNPLLNSSNNGKTKSSITHSILPNCLPKPRLKFSTVRDTTTTASSAHNAPVYSMPITRDYSIDERTNRIVNEFLMYDPSYDESRNSSTKRHHHHHHARIRAKTFEEPLINPPQNNNSYSNIGQKQLPQQPIRSASHKQRYYSTTQSNTRKHSQHQYPSIHLADSIEQAEEDNSDSPVISSLNSSAYVRRENSMATASPSIIITGDDSGS